MKRRWLVAAVAAAVTISYGTPAATVYAENDETTVSAQREEQLETVEQTQPEIETGYDADIDYEGIVSDYSGYSYSSGGTRLENVSLSENAFYDSDKRLYGYTLENGDRIYSNIMDGMIVNDKVQISFDEDREIDIIIYKDGKKLKNPDLTYINDTGEYIVEAKNDDGQVYQIMSFTIVGSITGKIYNYTVPDGFVVQNITYEDEEMPVSGRDVDMTQDGHYVIEYICSRTEVTYTFEVDIDHEPPVLKLKNVKNGVADGPVDISDLEEGATAKITLDGEDYSYRKTLTRSGKYKIIVKDKAGNQSIYEFEILMYFNMSSIAFFGIVGLIIAGVVIYLMIQRKKLKIR